MIALVQLLQAKTPVKHNIQKYMSLLLFLIFLSGINEKYISNNTALDKENVNGYSKIKNISTQVNKIKGVIESNDQVYYICQFDEDNLGRADLYNCTALFKLGD